MTKTFSCFVKYSESVFEILLDDERVAEEKVNMVTVKFVTFKLIFNKMYQVFQIALRKDLDTKNFLYELTDSTINKPSLVTDPEQKIRHNSVITVWQRPEPLSKGRAFVNDVSLRFLNHLSNEIIDFYLMIDLLYLNFRAHNFQRKSEGKWKAVANKLVLSYPTVFQGVNAYNCTQLFNKCTYFYLDNYYQLNLKLEPNQQKIFDMLKIIHLLDPNLIIKATKRELFKIINSEKEIQDYVYLQVYHGFDMYLNTHRMFRQSITHEDFFAKYILADNQILSVSADRVPITDIIPKPVPDTPRSPSPTPDQSSHTSTKTTTTADQMLITID